MTSRRFGLLFEPPRTQPLPDSARAHIVVNFWSKDKKGNILVSSECRTLREVEESVNNLKTNLDRVLAQARRKFVETRHKRV